MNIPDIETHVWIAVRRTINKFREQPYYFFSESDIVSYLWMSLYSGHLEAISQDGRSAYLVHREYPTNFRYRKEELLTQPRAYDLSEKIGSRGHYDLAVLNPEFVEERDMEHIVNKNVRDLEKRYAPDAEELLFAFEFKYVINNSSAWDGEIRRDNEKLKLAKQNNVRHAVNLVFCNLQTPYVQQLEKVVKLTAPQVNTAWIQSYYVTPSDKRTPRPSTNTEDALCNIGYL